MRVDLHKQLDKDAYNNIKTAICYPPVLALCKISFVNFSINSENIDNFGQAVPHFDIKPNITLT